MILVDTNILIDIVTGDPVWADWSRLQLDAARAIDEIAINEVVYAEICAGYRRHEQVDRLVARTGIALTRTTRPALFLAGRAFHHYRRAGGTRTGVLPDFFIGALAYVSGAKLLTRDPRPYRTYFPGVELIAPDHC